VGFAPCREPEIVVTALFENGVHGSYAAPIARDVIKAYYDKKARIEWTRRQQEGPPARPEPPAIQSPSLASAEEETVGR
jgi:penicillin-binding protein 2